MRMLFPPNRFFVNGVEPSVHRLDWTTLKRLGRGVGVALQGKLVSRQPLSGGGDGGTRG